MILEDEDLGYVAASGDVRCTGTVATFASLMGWTSVRIKRCLPVRGLLPSLVNVLMAGHADFRTHIAGCRRILRVRGSLGGIVGFRGGLSCPGPAPGFARIWNRVLH